MKKNNIDKALDIFRGLDKGKLPPNKVEKDSECKKKKRGDRNLKYKVKYDRDSE